jgi:para-nitrobenzyl esterase
MFALRNGSKLSRLVVRSTIAAGVLALVGAISAPRAQASGALYSVMTRAPKSSQGHGKGQAKTPAVVTQSGPLKGIMNGTTAEFLGIPYAVPPVGSLRWTPPQSFGRWHGLLNASNFGSACTQGGRGSENCLFLNVYVPNFKKNGHKRGGALPVMFWIHGGGLVSGAGSDYDPTPLVNQGVIVVTINYRLGLLGFFAQSAIDGEGHENGNYGLMDQQLAMNWVQSNIGAFGGDPGNVTIFGESAGGHSVYCQLASPTAAGLFAHAIAESGSYVIFEQFLQAIIPISDAETTGDGLVPSGAAIADSVGCSSQTAACLRGVSNTEMISVQPGTLYAFVDGTLLTETPQDAFTSGNFNRVPIIAGTNHDEWRIFVAEQYDLQGNPILTQTEYNDAVVLMWTSALAPFVEFLYPYASFPSGGVALGASGTDGIFACGARNADQLLSQFTTTFAYEFNDENAPPPQSQVPGLTFSLGAFHSAELQYLFNIGFFFELNASQQQLSQAMVSYWTHFAATGDPNSASTPTWAPYATNADQFQSLIPPTPVVESTFNTDHQCDSFWNLVP